MQHARLLVVTPDTARADTLRTRLTLAGYSVTCAADSASALAAAQSQMPDLALIAASEKNGFKGEAISSLGRALKTAADTAYLPVVLLTEFAAEAEEDWATDGVDDTLRLKSSDALLRLRVGTLLHLKRRYQALTDSVLEVEATCGSAQQEAARYEAVFMQNTEAMLLVGLDGTIAKANTCACMLAGCEPHALAEQPLTRLCPPELLWAKQLIAQASVRSFSDPNAFLVTVSGQQVPIEVRSAPVQPVPSPPTDASSNRDMPTLMVVTLSDRRPEQARLERARRAKAAETAAAFSREINNPLFVISSNIELLQNTLPQDDAGLQAKIGRITEAGRLLVQAAARLPDLSAPTPPED